MPPVDPSSSSPVNVTLDAATLALHTACRRARPEEVEQALRDGARVNAADDQGYTALHHLADGRWRNPGKVQGVVHRLLQAGADLNALTHDHDSPALVAAGQNHWALVDHLVKQGAGVQPGQPGSYGHASLLSWACTHAPLASVRVLLDHGAPVDHTDESGHTALAMLVWTMGPLRNPTTKARMMRAMNLLLERGASVHGDPASDPLVTPFAMAVLKGAADLVPRLLDAGAVDQDPRWSRAEHRQALMRQAILHGQPKGVGALVHRGWGQDWPNATWSALLGEAQAVLTQPFAGAHLQDHAAHAAEYARRSQVVAVLEGVVLRQDAEALPSPGAVAVPGGRPRL